MLSSALRIWSPLGIHSTSFAKTGFCCYRILDSCQHNIRRPSYSTRKIMTSIKEKICDVIERENTNLRSLSLDIWNNPELCYKEYHAHKIITNYLEEKGFQVIRQYKLDTAFRATYQNNNGEGEECVNVGVMCEYDALPGIGHACGHNLIAILGLAVSLGIKEAMETCGVKGKLTVLGTPAEEGGGGKIDLINAGAFADLDFAMMAHPSQKNLTKPVMVAMAKVDVEYHGKASHAASFPWEGVNALDGAVLSYQNVSCMRQHMKPSWRVHGIITNGGAQANIIPELACLEYYIRAPTQPELEQLKIKFIGCLEGAAKATGCELKYTICPKSYHSLLSNSTLASLYQKHGESLGIEFEKDPINLMKPGGSTDMGNVSRVLPSIHPKFGLIPEAPGHTTAFRDVVKTESSHGITLLHAKSLALAAVEVMQNPSLCQTIKNEFNKDLEDGQ